MLQEQLQQKLKELATAQKEAEENAAWIENKEQKLRSMPEYVEIEKERENYQALRLIIDDLRSAINDLTIRAYLETGEKKPVNGAGIRIKKNLVYDKDKALCYCLVVLPEALKLDTKIFEKYAKDVADVKPLPFVSVEEYPTATIASDLREWLE